MRNWLNSLTVKYVAVFTLLVAVPALAVAAYTLSSSYDREKRDLTRLQQQKAHQLARAIDDRLQRQVKGIAAIDADGLSKLDLERFFIYLRGADANITHLAYFDSQLREKIDSGQEVTGRQPSPDSLRAAAADNVYFEPVVIQPAGNGEEAGGGTASLDIFAASNYGGGVVWEQFLVTDAFHERISGERLGPEGYAYVLDAHDDPIEHPNRELIRRSVAGEKRILVALPQIAAADTRTGAATGRRLDGTKVIASWATVDSTGWKVFVEQPESAAFAAVRGTLWRTILIVLAFVAAAVALSVLLARRLVRPIKRLQVAAEAIGAGAYGERIELDRRDELGALATAFNHMAARVQELITGLERRVAERTEALEVASQHKSDFLANMSHELRTPLNAIVGFSQVLKQKLFGPVNEKQDEYLDDILSSADHLLALINDILDLSKVEAGQVELERALFSLREALERGVVMVRERALKNGVSLELELDPAVDLVQGDERRIRQVVFNLLSNAVKFTPRGGRVAVSAAQENGEVLVCVKDTGPGISADDQERIFEEFQQARDRNGERPEGTGLGLALSRSLVELHGGRIWVESEVGKGSTFTFTIPLGSAS